MCGCKANLMLCYASCFVYCDKKCILGAVERWHSNLLDLMSLILKICLWAFVYFMSVQNMFIDDGLGTSLHSHGSYQPHGGCVILCKL